MRDEATTVDVDPANLEGAAPEIAGPAGGQLGRTVTPGSSIGETSAGAPQAALFQLRGGTVRLFILA